MVVVLLFECVRDLFGEMEGIDYFDYGVFSVNLGWILIYIGDLVVVFFLLEMDFLIVI